MEQNRRDFFLRTGCAALGAAAFSAGVDQFGLISALAQSAAPSDYRALVCIFMGGGNDGNNMVMPYSGPWRTQYDTARGPAGLAIAQSALTPIVPPAIGQQFALHPNLAVNYAPGGNNYGSLNSLWGQGKLAVVCNTGPLLYPMTRAEYRGNLLAKPLSLFSHNDQVTQWQTAVSNGSNSTGWGGRVADRIKPIFQPSASFPTVTSISGSVVYGIGVATRPLAIGSGNLNSVLVLNGFNTTPESVSRKQQMNLLRTIDTQAALIGSTSSVMDQAVQISQEFQVNPTLTATFPGTGLGNQLQQVARIIKLNQTSPNLNLERQIFFVSFGGFDTHQNQLVNHGNLMATLNNAMVSFYAEMSAQGLQDRVTAFTLSDFGRTFNPAGTGAGSVGSDHAWGNHQFVMGGSVLGGNFYGVAGPNGTAFPELVNGGAQDTDSRGRWIPTAAVEQYAGTLATWFGLPGADLPVVFPLIGRFTTPNLGFMV